VLQVLINFCHRPAIRFGLARDTRSPHRTAAFASFLAQNNRHPLDAQRHDNVLRGRRFARQLFLAGLAGGAAWIAVESARALGTF
jgi:hypothetical protein